MTLWPFSVMKRNATSFFKNVILNTHFQFLLTKKTKDLLPLLDVLANKTFLTSVYKKTLIHGRAYPLRFIGTKEEKT